MISYVKCTCSKEIEIKCNYINEEQIKFLKKLYYNGLGEFLYVNNIKIAEEDLFNITCLHDKVEIPKTSYEGNGNLICVGGGKDSCVSLELLKMNLLILASLSILKDHHMILAWLLVILLKI